MGRRKKIKKDPLAHLHKTAQILLDAGEFAVTSQLLKVHNITCTKSPVRYECVLVFKTREHVKYSHIKEAKTKFESILYTLENLEMMGHGDLSSEVPEENDDPLVDPVKDKRKYKPRKKKLIPDE